MNDAQALLPMYVRTARDVFSRALSKLDAHGLDESTVEDLISAICVANQLPQFMRDIMNAEEEAA